MTDRELLELAAKAAGIVLFDGGPDVRVPDECQARVWDREGALTILFYSDAGDNLLCKRVRPSGNVEWNPLTDDGDAFRLAVKLRMDLMPPHDPASDKRGPAASVIYPLGEDFDSISEWISAHDGDACAATRRAIVRAAAEIAQGASGSPLRSGARQSEQDAPGSSIVLGAEGEQ